MELEEQIMGIIINAGQSVACVSKRCTAPKPGILPMPMKNEAGAALRAGSASGANSAY